MEKQGISNLLILSSRCFEQKGTLWRPHFYGVLKKSLNSFFFNAGILLKFGIWPILHIYNIRIYGNWLSFWDRERWWDLSNGGQFQCFNLDFKKCSMTQHFWICGWLCFPDFRGIAPEIPGMVPENFGKIRNNVYFLMLLFILRAKHREFWDCFNIEVLHALALHWYS